MKSQTLQQSLVVAFFVAATIVCVDHIWEFVENLTLTAFGFTGLCWFYQVAHQDPSVASGKEEELDDSHKEPTLQPNIAVIFEEAVAELLTGTEDLWNTPISDAVVEMVDEVVEDKTFTSSLQEPQSCETPDPVEEIMHQLESLPQRQNRRKVWSALCDRLAVKGGGKVRDANLNSKAKFLQGQGVTTPMLVKAKVSVLTLNAA